MGESASQQVERSQKMGAQTASNASEASQGVGGKIRQAEQKARQRSEDVQQKAANKAMGAYVSRASGGLVKDVDPRVSNAALGYAKKNPQDAMKFAKFAAKAL